MVNLKKIAFVVAFMATACASTPAADAVKLYRYAPTVEWLTARDRVFETCKLIKVESFGDNGGPVTRSHAREYAARIQADTVLWWEYSEDPGRVEGDLTILRGYGVRGVSISPAHGGTSYAAFFACPGAPSSK